MTNERLPLGETGSKRCSRLRQVCVLRMKEHCKLSGTDCIPGEVLLFGIGELGGAQRAPLDRKGNRLESLLLVFCSISRTEQ